MALLDDYPSIRDALAAHCGPGEAAVPRDDPFAQILTVTLERSMDAPKAARVVDALRQAGLLDPKERASADPSELVEAARPAGVEMTAKAVAPLKRLAHWATNAGDIDRAATESLREELVAINGVGPASADEILMRALNRPIYPVDRASYRIFVRHGWLDPSADYEEARDVFERLEPESAEGLARLSSWLEQIGSRFCRPSVAKCDRCPLRPFLPEGGPIEPAEG